MSDTKSFILLTKEPTEYGPVEHVGLVECVKILNMGKYVVKLGYTHWHNEIAILMHGEVKVMALNGNAIINYPCYLMPSKQVTWKLTYAEALKIKVSIPKFIINDESFIPDFILLTKDDKQYVIKGSRNKLRIKSPACKFNTHTPTIVDQDKEGLSLADFIHGTYQLEIDEQTEYRTEGTSETVINLMSELHNLKEFGYILDGVIECEFELTLAEFADAPISL